MDEMDFCNEIFLQHESAVNYKTGIGEKGLFEQTRQNERFFCGDQWHGAAVSAKRPLVRHNLIKRIGDYKRSVIMSGGCSIDYIIGGIAAQSMQ